MLPIIGLLLFALVSYVSYVTNRDAHFKRSYYWSFIHLDRTPGVRDRSGVTTTNPNGSVSWEPENMWVSPGPIPTAFFYSALPAFIVGALGLSVTNRFGWNGVWTFHLMMPVLIAAWFYCLGRLFDRWQWRLKRRLAND